MPKADRPPAYPTMPHMERSLAQFQSICMLKGRSFEHPRCALVRALAGPSYPRSRLGLARTAYKLSDPIGDLTRQLLRSSLDHDPDQLLSTRGSKQNPTSTSQLGLRARHSVEYLWR